MNNGKYVFSQLMSFLSYNEFDECVERYQGNYKVKEFSCWKQFLCMAFGQLTHRESLSDTILCLQANAHKLYHLGIGKAISKSTLSKANENRDWRIYADFATILVEKAKRLYKDESLLEVPLKQNVFAIDATLIHVCLSVFEWASYRTNHAAIKMHTQLDLKNGMPEFIAITEGKLHEVNILDHIRFEQGSYYVMDRGYCDLDRLYHINEQGAFFIMRAKDDLKFRRLYSAQSNKETGVLCDQTVVFKTFYALKDYPAKIRRIKFFDASQNRQFVFMTNDFNLKATDVAQLYKHRWIIELFFKWIKQHLKIKAFWGTSPNAVKTQIWIAICVYVLVAIVKKQLHLKQSLYEILQVLSISIFDKTQLNQLFQPNGIQNINNSFRNQLKMFD